MSKGLAVYHGAFGRACLYHLDHQMAMHVHRECHLMLHVDGRAPGVTVSKQRRYIHPEKAIAINPWEPHDFVPTDCENGHLLLILYIDPLWIARNGEFSAMRLERPEIEVNSFIFTRTRRVIELMRQGNLTDRFDGYLLELTAECFERSQDISPPAPFPVGLPGDKRVRRSIEIITKNIQYGMEFEEVARNSGLSRSQFFQLFREQTGLTPNIFRNALRTEVAIDWLSRSDRRITDIGLDLSFSSQSSFTRFFVSNVGLSPTGYRRATHLL